MSKANDSAMTAAEGQGDASALDRTGERVETKTEINKNEGAKKVPSKKTATASKRVRRAPQKQVMSVPKIQSGKPVDVTNPEFYLNREINWIDFDRKVLEQAADTSVPLLERLKFLSIFFNNLDEFFMVRVANVWKQVQSGAEATGADKLPPRRQLAEIGRRVRALTEVAEELWKKSLLPELEKQSIRIVDYAD